MVHPLQFARVCILFQSMCRYMLWILHLLQFSNKTGLANLLKFLQIHMSEEVPGNRLLLLHHHLLNLNPGGLQ